MLINSPKATYLVKWPKVAEEILQVFFHCSVLIYSLDKYYSSPLCQELLQELRAQLCTNPFSAPWELSLQR